jgi:hypothetical protein
MADTTSTQAETPRWNWPWSAFSGWSPWPNLAPQTNNQDINPGWSFGNLVTVNTFNSAAPEVERAVVSQHSYGRQIGRLMDAVAALADALPKTATDTRIEQFRDLAKKVDAIKKEMAPERLARLKREVAELRVTDQKGFDELKQMFK